MIWALFGICIRKVIHLAFITILHLSFMIRPLQNKTLSSTYYISIFVGTITESLWTFLVPNLQKHGNGRNFKINQLINQLSNYFFLDQIYSRIDNALLGFTALGQFKKKKFDLFFLQSSLAVWWQSPKSSDRITNHFWLN